MILRPLPNVIWNLFLAVIPAVIALIAFRGIRRERRLGKVNWLVWSPLLFVWLMFLPNTCYLVTEWRHYLVALPYTPEFTSGSSHNAVFLYKFLAMTLFYVLYTGAGIICFFLAIYPLDVLFKPPWPVRGLFFFLCSLGVYLGLVDRFNSWQIVRHRDAILHSAEWALLRPSTFTLLVVFAAILWLMYCLFGLTMDGVRFRYRSRFV